MKNILLPANRPVLERFALARPLLVFHFDGVLAPLNRDPNRARMRRWTYDLFMALLDRHTCAIISGRARRELAKVAGIDRADCHLLGNHGVEPAEQFPGRAKMEKRVAGWRKRLQKELAPYGGVWIEDNVLTLSIHYREAPDEKAAVAAIDRIVSQIEDAKVVTGAYITNVIPIEAPSKPEALDQLRRSLGCPCLLHVGYDDTDEEVFRLASEALMGVRIGQVRGSKAPWFIHSQDEIDPFLSVLVQSANQKSASIRKGVLAPPRPKVRRKAPEPPVTLESLAPIERGPSRRGPRGRT